jgi:hypothetical protein
MPAFTGAAYPGPSAHAFAPDFSPQCVAPPMMFGDMFFGGLRSPRTGVAGNVPGNGAGLLLPEPGGFSRYTRVSESNSPVPQDRVFFSYNFLSGVQSGSANVNQFTFGLEQTFLDGHASVQVNVPFASTLDSLQFIDTGTGGTKTEFGNVSVWLKALLYHNEALALSAGLGVNTPTADDVRVFAAHGDALQVARVHNDAVHLNPFVGAVYTGGHRYFVQGFSQVDFDPNGNGVAVATGGGGLTRVGRFYAPTLFYIGGGAGFVLVVDDGHSCLVRRITPMVELHYTTDLGGANSLSGGGLALASRVASVDSLNLVAGTNFTLGPKASLNVGFGMPLIGDTDRQYNWQALLQLNLLFGGPH